MELPFLVTTVLVAGLLSPVASGEKTIAPTPLMRNGFDIESVLKAITDSLARSRLSTNSSVANAASNNSATDITNSNSELASATNNSAPVPDHTTSETHGNSETHGSSETHEPHDHSAHDSSTNHSATKNSSTTHLDNHSAHDSHTNNSAQDSAGQSSSTHETDHSSAHAPSDSNTSGSNSHPDHGSGDHVHANEQSTNTGTDLAGMGLLSDWSDHSDFSDHGMDSIVDQHGHIFDRGQIELECVIEEDCVFVATTPPDRFTSMATERWITKERFKKDPCEGQEQMSQCCSSAVRDPDFLRGFNRRIRRKSEDVGKICKLLCTGERDANCYLSCDLSSWLFMCTKPTSTSSPKSTTDSDDDDDDNGDGSSTTVSSQGLQDDDETGPSVTIIVTSCLVAFLAGIVGAILITLFFFRRRNNSKDSAETPQANTSAAYVSGDQTVYEELPEGTLYQKQSVKNRPDRISENEYTYIPDHLTTSRTASSSSYIVPVDHLAKRKLPTTPAQSDGQRENPGRRPANYSEPGNGARNSKPYFELEKEASQAEETAASGDQYFILEKEEREATATVPGNDDYYSPLKRDSEEDDGEYSALDRNKDCGVYTREYLELVPDYSLQKPVD